MRARLHAEREALERLLERIDQVHPGDERERSFLARQLRHFSFIEHTRLPLTEEQGLRRRYERALERILPGGRIDAVSHALVFATNTLEPNTRFLDDAKLDDYQALITLLRTDARSFATTDREALAGVVERRAGRLLDAIAQRARAAYGTRSELAERTGERRAQAAIDLYGATLTRVENRIQALIAAANELRAAPPQTESLTTLIIGTRSHRSIESIEKTVEQYGRVERFKHIPYLAVTTDERTADDVLGRAASLGHNARVYRERLYSVNPLPAVKPRDELWNLSLVKAPQAWDVTRGAGASVAVVDTGIDYEHSDLAERFESVIGEDFTRTGSPLDDHGHGTHVAGTVAGKRTGVAPEATLYAVKVLDASGYGTETSVLHGIEWCIDRGVDVINMSLGSTMPSSAERELVAVAASKGIALACAAGNSGGREYNYPASYDGATSVAAVDRDKKRAPFSTYNDAVDLAAPGVAIWSCMPGDRYDSLSGTSMATPHVAGAYALLKSAGINEPERVLMESAERLGERDEYGAGLIDCSIVTNKAYARKNQ